MLLCLLLDTPLLLFLGGPVSPFGNPLALTLLLWPFLVFPYLTGNPFFRQPFCGMWVTALEILLNHEEVETVLRRSITERTCKRLGNALRQSIKDVEQYERVIKGVIEVEYTEARNKLIPQIDDILKLYIEDEGLRNRIINRIVDTEAEGKTARWKKVLDDAGIPTTKKELGEIYGARSSSTHSGNSSKALPIERAHEIATSYIKFLLSR